MKEPTNQLRCFLIGETSLLIQCAQQLINHHFTIVGISSPDKSVNTWATTQNIPLFYPPNITTLKDIPIDFLFSIVNRTILSAEILALPTRYAINYHDAPLPKYAGVNATTWALINQEKRHGITWHVVSHQIDAGDILKQVTFDIAADETSLTLNAKCYQAAIRTFVDLIVELSEGREALIVQNLAERTYFGLTKRPPFGGVLSWPASAQKLTALIRALDFGPYPNPLGLPKLYLGEIEGELGFLSIRQAQVLPQQSQHPAGTVIAYNEESLTLATSSQDLTLSHFSTLDGQSLTVPEIMTVYHIEPGHCFQALPYDVAQQLERQGAALAKYEAFWLERLASLQVASLPYPNPQTPLLPPTFKTIHQPIPNTAGLQALEHITFQNEDAHPPRSQGSSIILAAFIVYLARLSNISFTSDATDQRVFDIGFEGVNTSATLHLAEFFATCVPACFNIDLSQSFTETCIAVWQDYQHTKKHQTYARDLVIRYPELADLNKHETSTLAPNLYPTAVCWGECSPTLNHDLALLIPADSQASGQLGLHYNRHIFDDETAARILAQILHLLHLLVIDPHKPLYDYALLLPTERQQLLIEWNNTSTPYPGHRCVHHLFEEQVARTATATALIFENQRLTYAELNAQANQLAHYLQALGVGPGTVVGVCVDYSVEMGVGLLGILKAGAAYTPLDPNYPSERLATMLTEAQIPVLLTQTHLKSRLPDSRAKIIILDEDWTEIASSPTHNPTPTLSPADDLIYVLFTSGSTGKPKGAGVYHRSFTNLVHWFVDDLGLGPQDKVLLISSISFDLTQKNIYAPLICGGTLNMVDMPVFDPQQIGRAIDSYGITWVNCTPSAFYAVLDRSTSANSTASLRYVVLGGEPIAMPRLMPWLSRPDIKAKIVNTYGPTECADICASFIVADPEQFRDGSIPLGKPINNVGLYIVDQHLQPVPRGCIGELCIAGAGVGLGYINHPTLTTEKFVSNPFTATLPPHTESGISLTKGEGERLYKSGDLARYLPDGNIEFLGRIDHQVKIRGFRVELGEIESTLNQHPAVQEAVVVTHQRSTDNKQLVAYIVLSELYTADDTAQDVASAQLTITGELFTQPLFTELRHFLQTTLPDHMLPAAFVSLPTLPLTPNGKVDRRALPKPTRYVRPKTNYVPPKNKLETQLVAIWQTELQLEQIGIDDNFFELGGHSLLLSRIHHQLQQKLDLAVSMVDLFRYPTIRALSRHLDAPQTAVSSKNTKRRGKSPAAADIAIVGMAGRFPGASNIEAFWQNLCEGRESITFFTDDDLLKAGVDPDLFNQPNYIKAGGVLTDIDLFDADFFSIPTPEAEILDPQIRLFMECAWEALEHAGCNPQTYGGDIGLYAGAGMNTYLSHLAGVSSHLTAQHFTDSIGAYQAVLANDKDFLATRVAYKLNLSGPALTVQSACSTSLVAVHLARQALLYGECDVALAGGVAVRIPHRAGYIYQEGMVFSPDGHCRAFDAQAQGMVMGNGLGIVVLKRLTDAQADGDVIHAVIKGSAINNDGAAKVGYTAPSVEGQIRVITAAHASAGIDPNTITYIETHGTGTNLGDPIEVAALNDVFNNQPHKQFCALGAVKTNIGHLDIASGVAGLIKTILALKHKLIPPTLHYHKPNPQLNLEKTPFYINTELQPWQPVNFPRRAGVSSYGIGGTNAHLVLEEADSPYRDDNDNENVIARRNDKAISPIASTETASLSLAVTETNLFSEETPTVNDEPTITPNQPSAWYLLTLSTKSDEALQAMAQRYSDFFINQAALNMAEVCYTTHVGRTHFQHRLAIVGDTQAAIQQALVTYIAAGGTSQTAAAATLFTSQNPPPRPTSDIDYSKQQQALQHLAASYIHGEVIDWPAFYQARDDLLAAQQKPVFRPQKTILPTYPFQRQRYWIDNIASPEKQKAASQPSPSLAVWQTLCTQTLAIENIASLQAQQWLAGLWQGDQTILAKLQRPPHVDSSVGALMPEGLLQACIQVTGIAGPDDSLDNPYALRGFVTPDRRLQTGLERKDLDLLSIDNPIWQPVTLDSLQMHQAVAGKTWWCYATHNKDNTRNFQLVNDSGQLLVEAHGLQLQPVKKSTAMSDDAWQNWLYSITWQEQPRFGLHPDYIPAFDELLPENRLPLDLEPEQLHQHLEAMAQLESLAVEYILLTFKQAGIRFKEGRIWSTNQLMEALGVIPPYRRLLLRLVRILVEEGILVEHDDLWQVQQTPLQILNPHKRLGALAQQYESVAQVELTLLQRCGPLLGPVLQGRQNPLELLYPKGDTDIVQQMYQEPEAYLLTHCLQQIVEAIIKRLPPDRGIRILEIGAGSGSTTHRLLPHLPVEQTVYTFTDIGPLFVERAKEKFSHYSFVKYHTLDIEQAPTGQGFKNHHYEVVIAANVLHATQDLRQSVSHVRQLLTPAGLFILLEDTSPRRWVDLTFGLTEGWWRFTDTRTEHPLITVTQWQELLADSGFQKVGLPDRAGLGRSLFLAQADTPPEAESGPIFIQPPRSQTLFGDAIAKQTVFAPGGNERLFQPSQTLIFANTAGVKLDDADSLQLDNQNEQPIVVYKSDTYQQVDACTFYIRPDSADDYQRLLQAIPAIKTVIYLWALDSVDQVNDLTMLPNVAEQNCVAVLYLIQALIQLEYAPKLWLITQGVMACADSQVSAAGLSQSPLWGLGKVIALEQPGLWGGLIDLPPDILPKEVAHEAALIRAEISTPTQPVEDHVAFRQGKRYVARLTPFQGDGPAHWKGGQTSLPLGGIEGRQKSSGSTNLTALPIKMDALTFEPESTYLITGGLGYLGLHFAHWLVDNGVRHVALMGRNHPSPAAEQSLKELRHKLDAIDGRLIIQQANVAHPEQVAQVLAACQHLPPLRGVIHAAGIIRSQKVETITAEDLTTLFEARVYGAWLLHTLTQEMSLDHFICFSSAGSVWGAEGQAHYDAASHFVDSLSHYRQGLGLPALTINWGMVAGPRLADYDYFQWLTKIGMKDIPAPAGCQAVAHLLTTGMAQALVANMDWQIFKPIYQWRGKRPLLNKIDINATSSAQIITKNSVEDGSEKAHPSAEEQFSMIITYLENAIIKLLRLPHTPDHRQGFFEMGLDSLMTIELRNQIKKTVELDLPLDTLLKNDTIESLASLICTQLETIPNPKYDDDTPNPDGSNPPDDWIEVVL